MEDTESNYYLYNDTIYYKYAFNWYIYNKDIGSWEIYLDTDYSWLKQYKVTGNTLKELEENFPFLDILIDNSD